MDGEQLVFGMTGSREREASSDRHALTRNHRAAVVEHEPHGDRDIRAAEERDCLLLPVFKYAERMLRKAGNGVRPAVEDVDVQDDEVGFSSEQRRSVLRALGHEHRDAHDSCQEQAQQTDSCHRHTCVRGHW